MKHAVQPVIATLAADPATSQSLGIVQGVAAAFPTVGAIHVPTSCQGP